MVVVLFWIYCIPAVTLIEFSKISDWLNDHKRSENISLAIVKYMETFYGSRMTWRFGRAMKIERKAMIRNLRHQRERRTHLMLRHHNQNTTSRKPKGQFLYPKQMAEWLFKIKLHQDIQAKTHNDRNWKPHHVRHGKSANAPLILSISAL